MFWSHIAALLCLITVAISKPLSRLSIRRRDAAITNGPDDASSACGDIIVAANQGVSLFYAEEVYSCLRRVPFDPAVATRFLSYYNTTLQFHSTQSYLKSPPEGYQQPPVDIIAVLNQIQQNITSGVYRNQYAFEADLQLLVQRVHDAHVQLDAGALSPFTFASPVGLVSASIDGKQSPKIYLSTDVIDCQNDVEKLGCPPSPVTQINGVDVTTYLTKFAELNVVGYLEPHADWNALMDSPVKDIQGTLSAFQSALFYPGDSLNFTYENVSQGSYDTFWVALYNGVGDTGPLTTAGDFYNYFVLGNIPANYTPGEQWWPDEDATPSASGDDATVQNFGCRNDTSNLCQDSYGGYPDNPIVSQAGLSDDSGVVTGYFLEDVSTGVLSIPNFVQFGTDVGDFSDTVGEFLANATQANTSRIVIDLQQNSGGAVLLAFDTFKRFFSSIEPYAGSRIRSHELANVLGATYTEWWNSISQESDGPDGSGANGENYENHAADAWVVTDRINADTGRNFSSWSEFYGPKEDRGDNFSLTERYNLSSEIFDSAAFGGWIPYGYASASESDAKPLRWGAEDIVILTDGLCSSACALFVELMVHQAGVRTITFGGRPSTGPMQAVAGTRGASQYGALLFDDDIDFINTTIGDHEAMSHLPPRDAGMWVNSASVNLRDQVRADSSIPLQFQYQAADCRMFYSLANVYNMSRLWRDAIQATWIDSSLCVQDSTGFPTARNTTSVKAAPESAADPPTLDLAFSEPDDFNITFDSIMDSDPPKKMTRAEDIRLCTGSTGCSSGCKDVTISCDKKKRKVSMCLPSCTDPNVSCYLSTTASTLGTCVKGSQRPSKSLGAAQGKTLGNKASVAAYFWFCRPEANDDTLGCSLNT